MSEQTPPTPGIGPAAPDGSEAAGAKPKRSKWFWPKIGCGGCGCLLVILFIVGFIGAALDGELGAQDDPQPTVTAETTTEDQEPAEEATTEETTPEETTPEETTPEETTPEETTPAETTPEETTEPEPTEEATTEAPEPTEEATTEEATEEPAEEADEQSPSEWAAAVEETTLFGTSSWQELCDGDYGSGTCYVADVDAERVGSLDVTLQVTGNDAEVKRYGEDVANTIFSTAGFEHEDLNWVIVYNAEGRVIYQDMRSSFPYLD